MIQLLKILGRFAAIVAGYAGAAVSASLFLNFIHLAWAGIDPAVDPVLLPSIAAGALFVGYFAFVPSTIAIIAGEIFSRRDWLFYALAGAASGGIVITLFAVGEAAETPGPSFGLVALAAGAVGGWVYWLISGRNAGRWRENSDTPTSSPPSGS